MFDISRSFRQVPYETSIFDKVRQSCRSLRFKTLQRSRRVRPPVLDQPQRLAKRVALAIERVGVAEYV